MRVQIVLDQADLSGVGILRRKRLTKQRIFSFRALRMHLPKTATSQRFDCGEQRARAKLFVGVMLLALRVSIK